MIAHVAAAVYGVLLIANRRKTRILQILAIKTSPTVIHKNVSLSNARTIALYTCHVWS